MILLCAFVCLKLFWNHQFQKKHLLLTLSMDLSSYHFANFERGHFATIITCFELPSNKHKPEILISTNRVGYGDRNQ